MSSIEARPSLISTVFPALNQPISVWLSCNFHTFHVFYIMALLANIVISCAFFAWSIHSMIKFYSTHWAYYDHRDLTPFAAYMCIALIYSLGAYILAAGSVFLVEVFNLLRFSPHNRPHFLHTTAVFLFAAISFTFGTLTHFARRNILVEPQNSLFAYYCIFGIANVILIHFFGLFITFLSVPNKPANADQLEDEENQLPGTTIQQNRMY